MGSTQIYSKPLCYHIELQ